METFSERMRGECCTAGAGFGDIECWTGQCPVSSGEILLMKKLRIGTCSWKYPSWTGLVYSGKPGADLLAEYAKLYNTVEIDQWFWSLHGVDRISLPRTDVVASYADSVPDDFRFTVKIPNSNTLTHFYRQNKTDPLVVNPQFLSVDLFGRFLDRLEPMAGKLGPLMFQFEYLNRQKMPSLETFIEHFAAFLSASPQDFIYGVEIRNPNYLKPAYFAFLETHKLLPVFLQGYYMPPIWEVIRQHEASLERGAVIRLHGPDRKGIEKKSGGKWNRILVPRNDELDALCEIIRQMDHRGLDIWLNVNNHFEGSAPLTIQRFRARCA